MRVQGVHYSARSSKGLQEQLYVRLGPIKYVGWGTDTITLLFYAR